MTEQKTLRVVDQEDYESTVDGHVKVSSRDLDICGAYIAWHTQSPKASECLRPPTAEHQFVLYCSEEERGEYRYNDQGWRQYVKRRNEWFIAPAFENQIRWKWNQSSAPGLICRFHLSPELLTRAASLQNYHAVHKVRLSHRMNIDDSLLTELAFELREELFKIEPTRASSRYSESLVNAFTHRIVKAYGEPVTVDSLGSGRTFTEERKARLEAFIDANLDQPVTVDDMAQEVWISKYHFSRLFKATYGDTPSRYLQRRRIAKACRLLRETKLSVTEIALRISLSSDGGFSRCFKNNVGKTPSEYRRRAL